jgi:protocatechuate 3,4-dioxygenase beta subunit
MTYRQTLAFLAFLTLLLSAALAAPPAAAAAGIPLEGRVVDEESRPLADARVELRPVRSPYAAERAEAGGGGDEPVAAAASGGDGRYRLEAPGPGFWRLTVTAAARVDFENEVGPVEAEELLGEVVLAPAVEVVVRVVDAADRPVAGATVAAAGDGAPPRLPFRPESWRPLPRRRVVTGDDGRAVFQRREGETLALTAVAPGLAAAVAEEVADAALTLRLPAGAPVTLEVRDAGGRPVAGALVGGGNPPLPWGETGEEGRLELRRDPAAKQALWARAADGRSGSVTLPALADGEEAPPADRPVVIELSAPAILAGSTLDGVERQPVAGAWVWRPGEEHLAVRSDPRGGFALPLPDAAPAWVRADAAGFGGGSSRLRDEQTAGREPVTLLLPPTAAAAGRVVDEAGEPVAGAEISAGAVERGGFAFRGPGGAASARSGADGRFRLRELAAATRHTLHAEREGYGPGELEVPELEAGAVREGLVIVLPAGITAFGRVVDTAETPVAGAEVALRRAVRSSDPFEMFRSHGVEPETATTDAEGRFEIADLPAGRFDVSAAAGGFAPLTVPGVELPAGGGRADLGTLLLEPGLTLAGRVVDPQGRPVAEAEVHAGGAETLGLGGHMVEPRKEPAVSGPDGRFEVPDLARGERVDLMVKRRGYTEGRLPGVGVPAEEPVTVVLQPASTLAGVVVDDDGDPVEGAMVLIQGEPAPGWPFAGNVGRGRSGEDGRFTVEDVPPGRLGAMVRADGFLVHEEGGLEVAPGEDRDDLRFVLRPGATIRGRVTDAAGRPIADASVEVLEDAGFRRSGFGAATTGSDADGLFELDGVEPGTRSIAADHDGHVRSVRDLEVTRGDNRLDFRLEPGLTVSGRVLDEGGAPVSGARVSLESPDERFTFRSGGELTDDAGAFAVEGVAPGAYTVSAQMEGFAAARQEGVEVAGAPVAGVELHLSRGTTVTGRLLGVELAEMAGARVLAGSFANTSRMPAFAAVDYDGSYRIDGLAPGEWTLMAVLGEGVPAAQEKVTVEPGQRELVVDLDLGAGGSTLSGRVLLGDQPLTQSFVVLQGREQTAVGYARTDHGGHFEIRGVDDGTYELQVSSLGGPQQHREEVEIAGDREILVRIAASSVSGIVLGGGGPLAGAEVFIEPEDAERGIFAVPVRTDDAGRFQLSSVAAGRQRLRAEATGHAPGETVVTVEEGVPLAGVELRLEPAAGLTLRVAGTYGRAPERVTVAALDPAAGVAAAAPAAGLTGAAGGGVRAVYQDHLHTGEGGRVRLDRLPAGRWRLVVAAAGLAAVQVDVVSPGPEVAVALPPAAVLDVRVPELAGTGALGEVRLTGGDGRPFVSPEWFGSPRAAWELQAGRTQVHGLPPGSWTLTAATPDGRTWSATAVTAPGATAEAVLE